MNAPAQGGPDTPPLPLGTTAFEVSFPPRLELTILPTPLVAAPRLSAALGSEIWIKRDDLCGPALGGNKFRKLEFILADALAAGADTLVSVGAVQSNHARSVAAAAAMLGLRCELVLGGAKPGTATGNLLLSELLGANVHFVGLDADWKAVDAAGRAQVDKLTNDGARPYYLPVGGSVPLGVVSFAAAYLEFREQCDLAGLAPATIVHASSSAGTQAGLELGRAILGDTIDIVGVDVAQMSPPLADRVRALATEGAAVLNVGAPALRPIVLDGYIGAGYAIPSPGGEAAGRLLIRTEGLVLDPAYTAKAAHALCEEQWNGPVVFWHTGGSPAVFA